MDTTVSPYTVDGRVVAVKRNPFDGSGFAAHVDSGELDVQRRLLIVPKVVDGSINSSLFFYTPEE